MPATAFSLSLPAQLGEFELSGILGEGGFSTVYTAFDHSLERIVAIKEYMPSSIATRLPDGSVVPRSPKYEETFKAGLISFLNEARLLAKFTHPALVYVHRIWEQNGTAYMVMQYYAGKTLRQINQSNPAIVKEERWLKATFAPLLDVLNLLHAQSCFHRDISPDNILILENGQPILLDFGAAHQVIGEMFQASTIILKPGFAPVEQYVDDASLLQGPWTDVYSIGALLYYLLTDKPPVSSVARLVKDPIVKLADSNQFTGVSYFFREAIDHALAVYPSQRIQSISEFQEALQLPTFKQDGQAGRSSYALPIKPAKIVTGEMSKPTNVELDDTAGIYSSIPISPSLIYPDRGTIDTVKKSSRNAAIFIKLILPSPRLWSITLLGIGLIIVIFAVILQYQHKPSATVEEKGASIVNQQVLMKNATKLPPLIDSSALPSKNSQTSAVTVLPIPVDQSSTSQESIPKKPAVLVDSSALPSMNSLASAADVSSMPVSQASLSQKSIPDNPGPTTSNNFQKQITESGTNVLNINERSANILQTPNASTNLPSEPINASLSHAVISKTLSTDSLSQTTTTSTKTKRKTEKSIRQKSLPAASQSVSITPPYKPPVVRLSIKPWGQVTVDGQLQGVSPPLTLLSLTPGKHVVFVTNENFPPATFNISIPMVGDDVVVSARFGAE